MLINIFKNKKYRFYFLFLILSFSFLYFIFKNFINSLNIFSLNFFSFSEKIKLFFISFFDISELKNPLILFITILFIFSISLLFLLILILLKESKKINKKRGFWHTLSIFISVLGLSCASCGIGLLASIFSFLGFSSLITIFPLHGLEFTILGIITLNISNYFLLKRLKNPFHC